MPLQTQNAIKCIRRESPANRKTANNSPYFYPKLNKKAQEYLQVEVLETGSDIALKLPQYV